MIALAAAQLFSRWATLVIAVALILVAYLINRFTPRRKTRIRWSLYVFVPYVILHTVGAIVYALGNMGWVGPLAIATDLFESWAVISIAALATFDLILPILRVELHAIVSDLTVGALYAAASVLALHREGVNLSGVLATSAVVSGILALSLQATLGNIIGGVALQLDGSIHVGDWIALENGKQGKVRQIRWRHTLLETRDWDTLIVPNALLLAGNITILGKRDGENVPHRMWVYFNVDFRYPPSTVIDVVTEALANPIERVAVDPKPNVVCMDLAHDTRDSFAYYAVRYWLTELAIDDPTNSVIRARVHAALKRAGIPLARPAFTQFMMPDDEQASSPAGARTLERRRQRAEMALKGLTLFHGLTDAERATVATHLRFVPFAAGETMTKQGAVAHYLYILTSGHADVIMSKEGHPPSRVTTLHAPDFFGEMGLMTGEPRHASVIAVVDVECYRLDKIAFEEVLHARPEVAETISTTLAKRGVELIALRDGLDAEGKTAREAKEQSRILERIRDFFGLADSGRPSSLS